MNKIQSYSDLEKLIEQTNGKPKILEALWDGHINGWFLCIMLHTKTQFSNKLTESQIGYISLGNDHRLFSGKVPPWPEAELAKEIGQKAQVKYNLEFYFPSPDNPDSDCPSYFEKHLAINCADCNKLIIPKDSDHLPKDCCFRCHLKRESNDEIIKDKEYNEGVNFYKVKDDVFTYLGYASDYKSFAIYEYTKNQFLEQKKSNQISIVKLTNNERMQFLRNSLCNKIIEAVTNCEEPNREEKGKWATIYKMEFKDKFYELQPKLNQQHKKIYELLKIEELLKIVIEDGYSLEFYIKDNFTHRDDALLRYLKYTENGKTTIDKFKNEFSLLLNETEIRNTLKKLNELKCIFDSDNIIEISDLGKRVI